MEGLIYMAALLVFASPSFQDSIYPRLDDTVKLALRVDRRDPVLPTQGGYLEQIKPIYWEAKPSAVARIDPAAPSKPSKPSVEVVVKTPSDNSKNAMGALAIIEAQKQSTSYEDLGIISGHQAPSRIKVDDILTYFKKSNKTEDDVNFSIPNSNRPLEKKLPTRELPRLD